MKNSNSGFADSKGGFGFGGESVFLADAVRGEGELYYAVRYHGQSERYARAHVYGGG